MLKILINKVKWLVTKLNEAKKLFPKDLFEPKIKIKL